MSELSQYYDFTKMYDGQYTIVSIDSNSLVLRPTKAPNQVIYPEYDGGAEIEHSVDEIEFEFSTQMPRIRQVPLGIKFKDEDISLKAIINGNPLDLSDKLICEGSVDYEHEGIYKLTYKINYLGYELEYVKLIAVSRVEWLKYLVPECFRDEGSITKEIINRLEQMYWSFSNQFDATRYILSDTKIACPSFEEHPELAGYIFDTTNDYLFTTLNLASGHKFKLEASESAQSYLCTNQIIAKEFNLGSSYIEGDIARYSSKTYRRNAEEDDNLYPGESKCWDIGYLIHTNADAEIKAAISSNQIIYRDDYRIEYAGYIYEFNSENLKLNDNNDILDIISIQKNNYAYLTPPRCIGIWSNAIEKLAIENDLVIAFDEEFKAHNLIRNDIKYSKQAVAPYDEDNELWSESKIWKLSEYYHGQEAYAKRVNNLTEFEIKNYALELGISESLLEVIHKYNKDDISILYAIQFVVKYHHTIPGFLFLVRLIGLKIEHLKKSNPEEIIRIDGEEISDIQDQLNALSSIDLANSAGLYDSTKTYNPGDIVFDDNNIYEIGDNGQPLPTPKWSYEYKTDAKDCNNAYYEVDVSTKNYASDDCNKDIVNLGESEATTYIDDDGLKFDILSNLKIVQNYSIPAYIIVRMKLHFYSQMKLSRWSIGHATYHFDSYHGIPPFCIMFDSMAVVSLGGSVYQPLLEVVKAKIYVATMDSQAFWTEAYPRQVMRIPVDENGRSKFRLKIELPAGYSLKKWKVQGLGDVEHFDSHSSIDNTSNLTNFVAEAVKGDSLVTALIYARFQLILYLHEQDGWTPRTGTYEMYVQGETVQDMIDAIESVKIYYGDDPENLLSTWASNVRHEGNSCIFRGINLENVRYLVAYPHCTGAGFELFKFTPADTFDTTNLINSEMKFQIFEGSEGETYRIIGRIDGVDHLVVDSNNNNLVGFIPTEE